MGLNDTPYSEREDWKDVVPVPQDDGPLPLAAIRYPHGFVEVHD
jgi:protein farnesyltransferase/geranylgeranyltransferase type-1 subunit alpha